MDESRGDAAEARLSNDNCEIYKRIQELAIRATEHSTIADIGDLRSTERIISL